MNLFSILIADQPEIDVAALPPRITRNIASLKDCHPDLPHRFFDQAAVRNFLRSNMEPDVLWTYEQLLPYAYRADLARLCLLYELGGVYADLSMFFHADWRVRPGKLAVFRDRAVIAPWIVSNTVISAPPRFPALEGAIRMIVANCRARYRGASPLCPTGPVLFGKAIAIHCEPDQIHLGEVGNVSGRSTTEALVFVDATDGRMIGHRTKTAAGLAELGLREGVNNYNDFYHAGTVYAADFPVTLDADHLFRHGQTLCTHDDGTLIYLGGQRTEASECIALCQLPFPLAPGAYEVTLALDAVPRGAAVAILAATNAGQALARSVWHPGGGGEGTAVLPLHVRASRADVVIGILATGVPDGARIRIAGLCISRLQDDGHAS